MTYEQFVDYHKSGDAGVEGRTIARACQYYKLNDWQTFKLIYFYTMTYHIPSCFMMYFDKIRDPQKLTFRTDRRYVRCNGAFGKLCSQLDPSMLDAIKKCNSTSQALNEVQKWYFFGRYAAFLFMEVFLCAFPGRLKTDDVKLDWDAKENYAKGAMLICKSKDINVLDRFLTQAKRDTGDNVFALETSLCAVAKFAKGTRYYGYYTQRMLDDAQGSKFQKIIYQLAR